MHSIPKRSPVRLALAFAAIVGLAAIGANAGPAAARPHGHGHGHGHGFDMLSMLEARLGKLDLDESTRTAVSAAIDEAKPAQRELQAQIKTEHQAMREAMEADQPNEATVLAHADRIGELTTELRKQHLRTLLAVKAQLTPEQREALRPRHGGRDGKHGMHRRGGPGGGPGGCADEHGAEQ